MNGAHTTMSPIWRAVLALAVVAATVPSSGPVASGATAAPATALRGSGPWGQGGGLPARAARRMLIRLRGGAGAGGREPVGPDGSRKGDFHPAPKSYARRDQLLRIQEAAQRRWSEEKIFEADSPEAPAGTDEGMLINTSKFFVTFPYPYMNGLLHLGHAFSLTKVRSIFHCGTHASNSSAICRAWGKLVRVARADATRANIRRLSTFVAAWVWRLQCAVWGSSP